MTAVVGGAVMALGAMRKAAEWTSERIQQIGRFNAEMTYAMAIERVSELSRAMKDAAQNGTLYARSQEAATRRLDTQAGVMREVGFYLANIGETYNNFMAAYLGMWEDTLSVIREYREMGVGAIQGFQFGGVAGIFVGAIAWFQNIILQALEWLGLIANNTKPDAAKSVNANQWFISDIQRISGRRY